MLLLALCLQVPSNPPRMPHRSDVWPPRPDLWEHQGQTKWAFSVSKLREKITAKNRAAFPLPAGLFQGKEITQTDNPDLYFFVFFCIFLIFFAFFVFFCICSYFFVFFCILLVFSCILLVFFCISPVLCCMLLHVFAISLLCFCMSAAFIGCLLAAFVLYYLCLVWSLRPMLGVAKLSKTNPKLFSVSVSVCMFSWATRQKLTYYRLSGISSRLLVRIRFSSDVCLDVWAFLGLHWTLIAEFPLFGRTQVADGRWALESNSGVLEGQGTGKILPLLTVGL